VVRVVQGEPNHPRKKGRKRKKKPLIAILKGRESNNTDRNHRHHLVVKRYLRENKPTRGGQVLWADIEATTRRERRMPERAPWRLNLPWDSGGKVNQQGEGYAGEEGGKKKTRQKSGAQGLTCGQRGRLSLKPPTEKERW